MAAGRGHRVTLFERDRQLGGALIAASILHPENQPFLDYLRGRDRPQRCHRAHRTRGRRRRGGRAVPGRGGGRHRRRHRAARPARAPTCRTCTVARHCANCWPAMRGSDRSGVAARRRPGAVGGGSGAGPTRPRCAPRRRPGCRSATGSRSSAATWSPSSSRSSWPPAAGWSRCSKPVTHWPPRSGPNAAPSSWTGSTASASPPTRGRPCSGSCPGAVVFTPDGGTMRRLVVDDVIMAGSAQPDLPLYHRLSDRSGRSSTSTPSATARGWD